MISSRLFLVLHSARARSCDLCLREQPLLLLSVDPVIPAHVAVVDGVPGEPRALGRVPRRQQQVADPAAALDQAQEQAPEKGGCTARSLFKACINVL